MIPSKSEHQIDETESQRKAKGDSLKTSEEIKSKSILKETISISDSKRTYEVDQSKLKSLFEKTSNSQHTSNENKQFQFQFFNNREPMNLPVFKLSAPPKLISNGRSNMFLNKANDTASEEDVTEKPVLSEEIELKNETFFFFDIDDRLKDGLESFVRTEDLNELERTWPIKRKEIGEALRTKHRKAVQRKDKHRVFNHRYRQKQYSSFNPIPKSNLD